MATEPRYIRDQAAARAADRAMRARRIAHAAAIETLRAHAEGREPHLHYASCPTADDPHQRCVRCPVCMALTTLET